MFPLCYRRCQLPRKATLANCCLICNIWHFRGCCAMFLDFSLLEAVRHFCFHLNVRCSNHTVMLRSQNNYITSILILFMLASVCQSNSRPVVGTNTNFAAGELCGGSSICSGTHGLSSTGQDGVVRFVGHSIVSLFLTSSNKIPCFQDLVQHDCSCRYFQCSRTSLAIESDQVALQSYSEVCLLLLLMTTYI
jgi:hypothetical protein